jgi:hypothetical protein
VAEVLEAFDDGSSVATIAPPAVDEDKGEQVAYFLSVASPYRSSGDPIAPAQGWQGDRSSQKVCETDGLDLLQVPPLVTRRRSVVFTSPQKRDVVEAVNGRKKT